MNDNVENMILAQLRELRAEMGEMKGGLENLRTEMNERFDDMETRQKAFEGMLISMAGYMRGIDERVEHIEAKLGIDD
ncbi:MAG: hypothetical protein ACU0DW_12800 [Shimia sp.]